MASFAGAKLENNATFDETNQAYAQYLGRVSATLKKTPQDLKLSDNDSVRRNLGLAYLIQKKKQANAPLTELQKRVTQSQHPASALLNELSKPSAQAYFSGISIVDEIRRKVIYDQEMKNPRGVAKVQPKSLTGVTFPDSRFVQLQDKSRECWTLFNEFLHCSKPYGILSDKGNEVCEVERFAARAVCDAETYDQWVEHVQEGTWWGVGMPDANAHLHHHEDGHH